MSIQWILLSVHEYSLLGQNKGGRAQRCTGLDYPQEYLVVITG